MVKSPASPRGMQANKKAAVKEEKDAEASASPTMKKEAPDEDEEEDEVPLGRRMKPETKEAAEASSSPKTQKKKKPETKDEDEEDDLPLTNKRRKTKASENDEGDDLPLKKKKTKAKGNGQVKKEPEVPTTKVKTEVKKSDAVSSSKGKASTKVVKKVTISSMKQKVSKEEPEKREKKMYDLPGQKHEPPDERDPIRIFYESLYNENPESEMAELWMMEHGLLEADDAERAFQKKKKNQLSQKLVSPSNTPATEVNIKSVRKSSVKIVEKNSKVKVSKVKEKADLEEDDIVVKPKKKIKKPA